LIHEALEAELEAFLEQHRERRDSTGRQAVVRGGYLPEREVLTGVERRRYSSQHRIGRCCLPSILVCHPVFHPQFPDGSHVAGLGYLEQAHRDPFERLLVFRQRVPFAALRLPIGAPLVAIETIPKLLTLGAFPFLSALSKTRDQNSEIAAPRLRKTAGRDLRTVAGSLIEVHPQLPKSMVYPEFRPCAP
jgi:hypothetical protein